MNWIVLFFAAHHGKPDESVFPHEYPKLRASLLTSSQK
jgi:hypothetical protein